jgi:putative hydrolase of the HAD superfamily
LLRLMPPIRAVAFDVDGTLYPFAALLVRAAFFGARNARYARAFFRTRDRLRSVRPIPDFRECQAELFSQESRLSLEAARAWIERRIYGEWVDLFRAVRPYRDVQAVFAHLRRLGLKTAILSDYPVTEKLGYLGLDGMAAVAMCSEEAGYLKPNPEPFRLLCRRLQLEARQILYVGDNYANDIQGAVGAGLMAAHLTRRRLAGSVAHYQFSRYPELLKHVESLVVPGDEAP